MGHSLDHVVPKYTVTLCLYGSVLDALIETAIVEGSLCESTAISEKLRCDGGS